MVLVIVLTLVVFILMLLASVSRRRTLLPVRALDRDHHRDRVLRAAGDQHPGHRAGAELDPAPGDPGRHAWRILSTLRGFAALLFWLGLVLTVIMYLVGPGRFPVALRRWVVSAWRWVTGKVRAVGADEGFATWVARYIDPLRIGGVVLAALLLLWLSSWTALFVIGVVLVIYEVGMTIYARSTPEAAAKEETVLERT